MLAPEPDFALTLATDRFEVTPGKPAQIAVAIQRKDGDVGPIEITGLDGPIKIARAVAIAFSTSGVGRAARAPRKSTSPTAVSLVAPPALIMYS